MKAVNLALVALAGFGMAASQVAYADTLPGAALPSVQSYHPAKLTRLTSTRATGQAASADAAGLPAGAIILGGVALAGLVVAIVEVTKNNNNPVSTGS